MPINFNPLPSLETLNEHLTYDPFTGIMRRRSTGKMINAREGEYVQIYVAGKTYRLHRIAYYMGTGINPEGYMVDHKNRDLSDVRICNLRRATPSQNQQNKIKPCHNTSGYKGVCFEKSKADLPKPYKAYIDIDGKRIHLGYFADPSEAHAAYREAAVEFHGDFASFK